MRRSLGVGIYAEWYRLCLKIHRPWTLILVSKAGGLDLYSECHSSCNDVQQLVLRTFGLRLMDPTDIYAVDILHYDAECNHSTCKAQNMFVVRGVSGRFKLGIRGSFLLVEGWMKRIVVARKLRSRYGSGAQEASSKGVVRG